MECLKFKIYSPFATFKTPLSLKGIETYPLPPYSIIIGLIYTALGRKWNGENFLISIQGDYQTLFRDYIRFKKYNRKDKKIETLPLEVPRLYNFESTIHIVAEKDLLKEFEIALKKPKHYLFLGGGEYPTLVYDVKIINYKKNQSSSELRLNAYVPVNFDISNKEAIFYLLPSFYKSIDSREYNWVKAYYYQKGTYFEGEVYEDEEGDFLWIV